MKEIVVTGECGPTKNDFRNDDEEHDSSTQQYPPITSWLPHPIFSFRGLKEFWPELVASFWRGELLWHGRRLASHLSDVFYWVSSTAAIGFTVATLLRDTQINLRQRSNLWLALLSFAVLVVSTVLLSISFDYR